MAIHPHSGSLSIDTDGNLRVRNLIWNTSTLQWENATGTLAGGIAAAISNFPATQAVTQSGTWTVQPGNTANTTAWKVDASSVAVPVTDNSGSLTVDYATTGSGTATGALRVELPTNGTGVVGLNAGTAAVGKMLPPDVDVTTHTNYAKKYYTNAGAVTDGIIWSPASGKRWHVVSMFLQTSAAATVTLEDDKAGGDEAVGKMELAANQGLTINFGEKYPLASGEDAADLMVTTSAGNIYIITTGYEV